MASISSHDNNAVSQNEFLVHLKTSAHLRPADQSGNDVVVAGAGIIDAAGKAVNGYRAGSNVLVHIQEPHQIHANRIKTHIARLYPMPPDISYEDAVLMVYPFIRGLDILQHEMGISLDSMTGTNNESSDIGDTVLILGGESALGNALTQLLHIARPSANILVACRGVGEAEGSPSQEEALSLFCVRAVEMGAKYAIDSSAPDLLEHLRAAFAEYGGGDSVRLIFDATGEVQRRPEMLGLLETDGKVVNCSRIASTSASDEEAIMACLGELLAAKKLQPPLCNDIFAITL